VLVADDFPLVRQAIRRLFAAEPGWEIVAEGGDGREAVRLAVEHKPDLAVLDASMPALDGFEAARQIARAAPEIRILMLTVYDEEPYVTKAFEAGVDGYLLKEAADCNLIRAARAVVDGRRFVSPGIPAPPAVYVGPT
jgi:DNA-binding NarL/FixJ family response regulator